MSTKLRVYDPRYQVSLLDRVYDFFSGRSLPQRREGVDYTLLNRASLRTMQEFLDGVTQITLLGEHSLGDEMLRVDSTWRLATEPIPRRSQVDGLTSRLRVGQVQGNNSHKLLDVRWFQYEDLPGGTRLLIRLVRAPNPSLRTFVSGNLNEDEEGDWMDYLVGLG